LGVVNAQNGNSEEAKSYYKKQLSWILTLSQDTSIWFLLS
jgi:hypothetical protein